VDGGAASLCRISLLIALSDNFAGMARRDPACADAAIADVLEALRRHVVVSDTKFAASQDKTSQPAVAADRQNWTVSDLGRFDVVVGNPPYISHGSRNQGKMNQSLSRYLRRSYPEAAEYKIRTHSIFQDIALRYAGGGGAICLLLPDAFLTGRY